MLLLFRGVPAQQPTQPYKCKSMCNSISVTKNFKK